MHLPLGQAIPDRAHAVSCSLPTMRDVIGYEEKDPEILRHLDNGYPRFVLHRFNRQLTARVAEALQFVEEELWLCCSARVADALAEEMGAELAIRVDHEGVHGVAHPRDPQLSRRAKVYLQNIGGFLSSREAEDRLAAAGVLPEVAVETLQIDSPREQVLAALRAAYPGTANRDIVLAPSGMNAFHAAWRSLADLQASRGRTVWIQAGWLYLDTIAQLQRFTGTPENYRAINDVTDLGELQRAIEEAGDRFAGIVTEAPTNPLVQTADFAALTPLVHAHGGRLIIDPTLVSPLNVDVLPHADLVVNSLTKYTAAEGDVIAGATIVNPAGPDADWLRQRVAHRSDPIYRRDLQRLASQISEYEPTIRQTNANARQVVEFLRSHPGVKDLYWATHPSTAENYRKIARDADGIGSIISFTVHGPLAAFFDRLALPKGPSFGMRNTLICPFIYLAHYDLVTTESGQAELAAAGIDPNLLRLSVGTEPAADIIAALEAAFADKAEA